MSLLNNFPILAKVHLNLIDNFRAQQRFVLATMLLFGPSQLVTNRQHLGWIDLIAHEASMARGELTR